MRRSVLGSVALLGVFLAGCEDGPNQPYSPAGANAAGNWNNAGPDAGYNDPGTQAYDAGGGGTNSVNVCSAAQQNVAWTKAFQAPLVPPFEVGGIDLSAGGTFANVTIEDVLHGSNGQAQLCQGTSVTCQDGSGFPAYAWGPSQQLSACYDPASHNLTFFLMLPGYDGKATFTLPKTYGGQPVPLAIDPTSGQPADLNFVWEMGQPITVTTASSPTPQVLKGKNGGPLWSSNGIDDQAANQMYLGMMYTFQPTLIAVTNPTTNPPLTEMTDPTADCLSVAKCRTSANADSSGGNFGVRAAGIYFDAANSQSNDAATAASPSDMYMYPVKFEPYSLAPYNEGLDTFVSPIADPNLLFNGAPVYGPYSPAGVLSPPGGTQTPFCTLFMGATWGDFVKNCVNVNSASINTTSMAKLLSAQHHTAEWFQFSVVGINQNFSADKAELTDSNGQPTVLQDSVTTPNNDDVATDFYVDVRSSGPKLDDQRGDTYPPPAPVTALDTWENTYNAGQDLHGTAAVMGYYRQLVQTALQAQLVAAGITPVANPEQCWFDGAAYPPGSVALTKALQAWQAPKGCTGFEQMLTPAAPTTAGVWTDYLDVTPEGYPYASLGITAYVPRSIFQPGNPELHFMAESVDGIGFDNNSAAPNLLQASLSQVVAIMGHGNVQAIPPAAQDWRFYLQYWAQAYVKYLLNRSTNPTWQALLNNTCSAAGCRQVNQDNLFFDLNNGLDKFEYVDRTQATTLGAPVDFEYDILINTSNTQNNNFYQRLSRAESALYQSMLTDKTATPGSNGNVFLSDLFGSPAIVNGFIASGLWTGSADGTVSVWQCLTTNNPACTTTPPTDSNGVLLVDGQGQPLFTNYQGIFTGTAFSIGSTLPITSTMPYIASAIIDLPSYANPYDTTSTNTPISVLVPWLPSQPGTGFDIPINGQRTQFVQTGALDFSGVTITTNIDYLPTYDATSGALNGGTIAAVETQDFLGEVFPCVDPATSDILRVKMYSSTLDIITWLEQHPGAQAACNIYVRYSPYDNYVDYITSLANGVLMSVNPGAGGGPSRVGDATIFNPALLTQTQ